MTTPKIDYLQWRNRLEEFSTPDMRIGTDLILINEGFHNLKDKPFRCDVTTCIIYIKGWVRFRINMREFVAKAPCMIIMPYNAIIETLEISDEILTRIVVMSREFTDSLFSAQANISHLQRDITENPVMDLSDDEEGLISYYSLLKNLVRRSQSPYRLEAAKHLTLALFYSYTSIKHSASSSTGSGKRERKDEIFDQFVEILQKNFKREREVGFYADALCLTPKYLSRAVKDATGKSAAEWIDEYVVTESKALLYSTNQTIQQISDSLGFESQSLFGKFFKRVTGISPRAYRQGVES